MCFHLFFVHFFISQPMGKNKESRSSFSQVFLSLVLTEATSGPV
jgi:hypothetical protein